MLLSARMLAGVGNVNVYEYVDSVEFTQGDSTVIYFQLFDMSVSAKSDPHFDVGRRYIPVAGATLSITIENIDDAKKITRMATQPFAQDGSIWSISIASVDAVKGDATLRLTLTESAVVTRGSVRSAIKVYGDDC